MNNKNLLNFIKTINGNDPLKKKKERENSTTLVIRLRFFRADRLANHQERRRSLTVEEHANGRELQEDLSRNRGLAITENKQRQTRAFYCGS